MIYNVVSQFPSIGLLSIEVEQINIKIKIALLKISLMICHTWEIILHNHYSHAC